MKIKWTDNMIEVLLALHDSHTYSEISDKINSKYKVKTTPNSIRKAYERYKLPILKDRYNRKDAPKILLLDIETAPILANVWGLWKNNVGLNQIKNDWYVLSWCAKWYNDDKVFYEDQSKVKDIEDDSKLLKAIWKLLDEADIVVGQNSKAFDIKKLNSRFILNGMKPPSSFRQIDTLLIAKKHFKFTSNKLAYLTDKLCTKYKKSGHAKFSGFSLWSECMKGNKEAWKEMREYNILDVLSLEELYEKLLPWDDSINFSIYFEDEACSCGSTDLKKNGFYYTNASKFQKYRCNNCGSEMRDTKNLLTKKNGKVKKYRKNPR